MHKHRSVSFPSGINLHKDGAASVIVNVKPEEVLATDFYDMIGRTLNGIVLTSQPSAPEISQKLDYLRKSGITLYSSCFAENDIPLLKLQEAAMVYANHLCSMRFLQGPSERAPTAVIIRDEAPNQWTILEQITPTVIFLCPTAERLRYCRLFFEWLENKKIETPVILGFRYDCSKEDLIVRAAVDFGSLFCDRIGDGIWIDAPYEAEFLKNLSFNILKAAGISSG